MSSHSSIRSRPESLPRELELSIGNLSSDPPSLPNDPSSGTTLHDPDKSWKVEDITTILCKEQGEVRAPDESGHTMTINMLPDNVLLDIFDSCRKNHDFDRFIDIPCLKDLDLNRSSASKLPLPVWRWHGLVQVCQRWRQIIFGSPRRLDLQILCSHRSPVREKLDFLPPFPIAIQYLTVMTLKDGLSFAAALEHPGRIRQVDLCLTSRQLGEFTTVMQRPFPALTHLTLEWDEDDEGTPVLPSGFLGGSVPCLKYMHLGGILFPALTTFLSTSDLVNLSLNDIPRDGYISPEAMTTCLAALPRLKSLFIGSYSATSHTDRIRPPPLTRTLLPALTSFGFQGDSEYLEDLVARIDCPQLSQIYIKYLNPLLDFQVAQFINFVNRSEDPELSGIRHADINFSRHWVSFEMYPCPESPDWGRITVLIQGQEIESQVSHVAQVFSQPSSKLSRVVHLKLSRTRVILGPHTDEYLRLLRQFTAVQTLHVCWSLAAYVALTLEHVTPEMVAEVLPALDLIYLDELPVSCVEKFLTARRLAGHPITIFETEAEFDERFEVLRHRIR